MGVGSLRTSDVLAAEFRRIHAPEDWQELTADERDKVQAQNTHPDGPATDVDEAVKLAAYYKSVHALPATRRQTALCLSGGGIRSAAFCMGILQGLARRKLLGQFHYLSTVSGGGYIGSWLVAWAHRDAGRAPDRGFDAFEGRVAGRPSLATAEREPVEWLRGHQRFLNPDSSLTSPDTWAPIAIIIRDLLLNWLVFVPLILAALLVPRILEFGLVWWGYTGGGSAFGAAFTHIAAGLGAPVTPQPFPGWYGWCDALGAAFVLVAMLSAVRNRLQGEASRMDDAGFTRGVLAWMLAGAALLTMSTAVLAIRARDFDTVLLAEWCCGTALTLVLARVVARCVQRPSTARSPIVLRPWRSFMLECLALAVSGAMTGLCVWALLKLRAQMGVTGRAGVRDLVAYGVPLLLAAYVVGQVVYAGLTSRSSFGRQDQEWLARASGLYLVVAVLWAVASSLVLFSQELFLHYSPLAVGAVSGTVTLASATSTFSLATSALKASRAQLSVTKLATIACVVFLASGTVVLSHATAQLLEVPSWGGSLESGTALSARALHRQAGIEAHAPAPEDRPGDDDAKFNASMAAHALRPMLLAAGAATVLAVVSCCASLFVDVNLFSLHALYRNRLVRSFLGASNPNRAARNMFSGFSDGDDIPMQDLWPEGGPERHGPFPVVNMAINLAPTADLARQQRQASSFIATPLHMGGHVVDYVAHAAGPTEPMTLGTAMAISGAAFNANWGYHTSPLVRFVMMLFNVRLGWWARNPQAESGPGSSPGRVWGNLSLLVQETFGLLSTKRTHVYLSDGGHFDNLGLYEMLRRRCHTIVVVDASQDFDMTLEDLGRSLRNVAADMGVTVDFGELGMVKRTNPPAPGVYCAVGKICYPECDGTNQERGRLIYIKPGFYKDTPADVRAYAATNARFPHDTTTNQWFTESQFESYRTLGSHVLTAMFDAPQPLALADLPALAEQYMRRVTTGK